MTTIRRDYTPHHVNGALVGVLVCGIAIASMLAGVSVAVLYEAGLRLVVPW